MNLAARIEFAAGSMHDYLSLARYHYQPVLAFPPTKVYKLIGNSQHYSQFPDPLSVLVLTQPFPEISARTTATAGYFHRFDTIQKNLTFLNQSMLYLARLITDPRYLRKGLATTLLKCTLEQTSAAAIETLTPIDFTNRMYTKAGFKIYYTPPSHRYRRLMQAFSHIGLNITETTAPALIDMRLSMLPPHHKAFIEKEITLFLSGFRNAARFKPDATRTKFILTKIPPPAAYLLWLNPNNAIAAEIEQYQQHNPHQYNNRHITIHP